MRIFTLILGAVACALALIAPLPALAGATNQFAAVDMREGIALAGVAGLVFAGLAVALLARPTVFLPALVAVALGALLLATPAFAQGSGGVTIPYGDWIVAVANFLIAVAGPVIAFFLARLLMILPAPVADFIRTLRAEQLVQTSLSYGLNAVSGAVKGKTLSVSLGNAVLDQAVDYAVKNGAPAMVQWMGGEEGIRRKIFRALDIEESASSDSLGVSTS